MAVRCDGGLLSHFMSSSLNLLNDTLGEAGPTLLIGLGWRVSYALALSDGAAAHSLLRSS